MYTYWLKKKNNNSNFLSCAMLFNVVGSTSCKCGRKWGEGHVSISLVSVLSILFLIIIRCLSLSCPVLVLLSLCFLSVEDGTKWPTRVDMLLNKKLKLCQLTFSISWANSDDKVMIFFLIFPEQFAWNVEAYFLEKCNYFKMSCAESSMIKYQVTACIWIEIYHNDLSIGTDRHLQTV